MLSLSLMYRWWHIKRTNPSLHIFLFHSSFLKRIHSSASVADGGKIRKTIDLSWSLNPVCVSAFIQRLMKHETARGPFFYYIFLFALLARCPPPSMGFSLKRRLFSCASAWLPLNRRRASSRARHRHQRVAACALHIPRCFSHANGSALSLSLSLSLSRSLHLI